MAEALRTPNVSLTAELAAFISARVASGRYQRAREVVRIGLRLLERDETGRLHRAADTLRSDAQPGPRLAERLDG